MNIFDDQPLFCNSCSRYPYVDESVKEKDCSNFIYQYGKNRFVAENHSNPSIYYTAPNIIGTPTKFLFEEMITCFYITMSQWQDLDSWGLNYSLDYTYYTSLPRGNRRPENNYIDIEFHEAVYPIRVCMLELYSSGRVIKILAQDSDGHWWLLWDGSSQVVLSNTRLFAPLLQSCNFKTKMLRLELTPSISWDYYTLLDYVLLIGTSELILSRNPKESFDSLLNRVNCMYPHHKDVDSLRRDYKKAYWNRFYPERIFQEYCILCESDIERIFCGNSIWNIDLRIKKTLPKLSSNESKSDNLYKLPVEIILKILMELDFISLCQMSQVNRYFYNITQDPVLYTRLAVRLMYDRDFIHKIYNYFTPRCKYLQQLDLRGSNCGVSGFVDFLENCGKHLTHLRLRKCQPVTNVTLHQISKICKNLKELDLSYCQHVDLDDEGFSYLENLECLEHLNLSDTNVQAQSLCKILQKNQRMRKLYLKNVHTNLNEVAITLRNSCRDLEVVDLLFANNLTSLGVNALAGCKNLRIMNLLGISTVSDDSLCRLFSSCQRLEEVHLSCIVLTDRSLKLLTRCKNLEELHFYRVRLEPREKFAVIFEQCPKLRQFCFQSCGIGSYLIELWRERYKVYTYEDDYPLHIQKIPMYL